MPKHTEEAAAYTIMKYSTCSSRDTGTYRDDTPHPTDYSSDGVANCGDYGSLGPLLNANRGVEAMKTGDKERTESGIRWSTGM